MSRILLLTNPSYDTATEYLDAWMDKVITAAKQQPDTRLVALLKEEVTKDNITALIKQEQPQLVLLYGHGNAYSVVGFNHAILIQQDDNADLLVGKIVHSLSCDSGKSLGPHCIQIGTIAYIGYSEKFKFSHMNKPTKQEKLADEIAGFFLDPAYEAVLALIEGNTAEQAYHRSQNIYKTNLKLVIKSQSTDLNTAVASQLFHDLTYQVCLGNQTASF